MRYNIIAGTLLCFFISVARQSCAQLPLQQAITLTLQHYPTLKVKRSLSEAAAAHTRDVSHQWWPSMKVLDEANVGTDNGLYGSYFPMGTIPSTSGGIRANNRSDAVSGNIALAQLQWEVFNFGAYRSKREEALQQQQVYSSDADITANDLTVSVIRDYMSMLQYYSLMRIQKDNIARTHSVQQAVTLIVLHGLKPGVDSSIAAAELSKARLNYLDMQNGYNQARMHLGILTGLDSAAILPDTLYNAGLLRLLENVTDTVHVEDEHPALQYYSALFMQQKKHEEVIRKETMPKVSLMAAGWMRGSSIQYDDMYNKNLWSGLGYSRRNYLAGVSLVYNFTDIGHTRDRMREQRIRTRAAQEQLEASHTMLDNQLMQSQINIRTAMEKLREMPAQLNAARAAAMQKMALYKGGLSNIIEVTNALYVLNRAETDLIQTQQTAWQALFMQAFASNHLQQLVQELNH